MRGTGLGADDVPVPGLRWDDGQRVAADGLGRDLFVGAVVQRAELGPHPVGPVAYGLTYLGRGEEGANLGMLWKW